MANVSLVSTTAKEEGAGLAMNAAFAISAHLNKCGRSRVENSTWKGLCERKAKSIKHKDFCMLLHECANRSLGWSRLFFW